MGFLFGKKSRSIVPEFTGLQIQTAVNTMPIPLIYGCPRVQMNIIYVNGFGAVAIRQRGGKGILSSGKSQTTGYKYYATIIGGICEGTIGNILAVFDDQMVYMPSAPPQGKSYTEFKGGTDNNSPWIVVSTKWPADAFTYKDTAYVGLNSYPLDSSATLPQLNFILEGKYFATSPLNLYTSPIGFATLFDADPAQVIYDFLTNATYGTGFPAAYIDTSTLYTTANGLLPGVGDAALATYCQAVGLAWSVVLNNAEPASSVLDRWLKNLVVAPVWTGNILKFIPYYDSYCANNPGFYAPAGLPLKYFQPDVTTLFDLTDDNFIQTPIGDDPITVSRVDIADVKNVVRLTYRDRFNLFNDNVSEAKDENGVELYGPRVDRSATADEFTLDAYANISSQLQLQRYGAVRRNFSFKLGWQFCVLDPMDLVTITDTTLGLNKFPVRIISIEEDEKGILTVEAEEFTAGGLSPVEFTHQSNAPPTTFNAAQLPANVNTPFIFEPTLGLLQNEGASGPTVIIGASGGPSGAFDPNWGGCTIYLSNDNVTYIEYGTLIGPSRQGLTTAILPAYAGSNPDNTNTLSVDLTESGGTLDSATSTQAAAGLTLCGILDAAGDLELLAYTIATLTAPNKYDLTGLYRGLYGTTACSHASSSKFLRIDSQVIQIPLPLNFINQTIYAKLSSFNLYRNADQDLSTCTAYTYVPLGSGVDISSDPIIAALLAGMSVDLEIAQPDTVDLNLGGSGSCAPVLLTIDLN